MNHWAGDDYAAAWGSEMEHYGNYDYEDREGGYGEMNYMGNQMMLLEHGPRDKTNTNKKTTAPGTTTITDVYNYSLR